MSIKRTGRKKKRKTNTPEERLAGPVLPEASSQRSSKLTGRFFEIRIKTPESALRSCLGVPRSILSSCAEKSGTGRGSSPPRCPIAGIRVYFRGAPWRLCSTRGTSRRLWGYIGGPGAPLVPLPLVPLPLAQRTGPLRAWRGEGKVRSSGPGPPTQSKCVSAESQLGRLTRGRGRATIMAGKGSAGPGLVQSEGSDGSPKCPFHERPRRKAHAPREHCKTCELDTAPGRAGKGSRPGTAGQVTVPGRSPAAELCPPREGWRLGTKRTHKIVPINNSSEAPK